jgi:DNA-directed RNA polymerase subunit RPC12/RpoP
MAGDSRNGTREDGRMQITFEVETEEQFYCEECGDVIDDPVTVYVCSRCGNESSSDDYDEGTPRKCESCGIFVAKDRENCCPNCFEEVEQREVGACPICEESLPADGIERHMLDRCQ